MANKKTKKYILDMFPYPSGKGIHVGHVESYTATDIYSRYLRMRGFEVLHPQGWDAFGLPAENFAIKTGVHPQETTKKAIVKFKEQMDALGFSYNWDREINSSDPEYYKWTQWMFLEFYKHGLAYKKKARVNWCTNCKTVLANEQAEDGKCERCESEVIQKELEQWFFKITDFADDLIKDLNNLDWPESTKIAQKNWIGKSEGAEVDFEIDKEQVKIFTTRPDTLFGATYFVLSPEHPLVKKITTEDQKKEVENYIKKASKKTTLERTELEKEKIGVFTGAYATNPVNKEKIPVWIADYVMMEYGTGAIMAVPAHDERDWKFAKKYDLEIKEVVAPYKYFDPREDKETEEREVATAIVLDPKNNKYLCLEWKTTEWKSFPAGGIDEDDWVKAAKREVHEETGYKNLKFIKQIGGPTFTDYYRPHKDSNIKSHFQYYLFELENDEKDEVSEEEKAQHEAVWVDVDKIEDFINVWNQQFVLKRMKEGDSAFCDKGKNINSEFLDGLETDEAKKKMIEWLKKKQIGKEAVNYKLRDWLISRQRYWGAPIPIIYCDKCGIVPVPEKDLPVKLPTDVDFKPTGESPLVNSKEFHNVKCPKCGAKARRESDTMDTFVCSSWYYLRYADPKNEKEFASKESLEKWLPVDVYVGGAEHSVLHLLYARFFTKVLQKFGYLNFTEPFLKLRHQGTILAPDGQKMSKSKGNVINPDEIVKGYGADTLRMYEMFLGPLEDVKPWNTKGIIGVKRFLDKVKRLSEKTSKENLPKEELEFSIQRTIKKVTEDIDDFKFNTAISALMTLINAFEKEKKIDLNVYSLFLVLLSPFAPFTAEELWKKLGHKDSIFEQPWPKYKEELIEDEKTTLIIQVNGKLKDKMEVKKDLSQKEIETLTLEREKIKKYVAGTRVKKVIFIPNKLINLVI